MDYESIRLATSSAIRQRLDLIFEIVDRVANSLTTRPAEAVADSHLAKKVLRAMQRADLIESADATSTVANCIVFLVGEIEKLRNRIIAWPIVANMIISALYQWDHSVSQQADIVELCQQLFSQPETFAATYDLKASFYQLKIPQHWKKLFVFASHGKLWQWKRLPMGFVPSAEIEQLITASISFIASRHVSSLVKTHVDNFIHVSSYENILQVMDRTILVTSLLNVTL